MILFAPVRKNLRTRLTKKHFPRSSMPDKGDFGMVFYFQKLLLVVFSEVCLINDEENIL